MDLTVVENLIKLMKTHEVSDLSFEDADMRIRVRFGGAVAQAPLVSAAPARAPEAPRGADAPRPAESGVVVKSPMVGTFYRSSKPDAAPFASPGQRVKKGQVLCIVEAMKLMNEIESDVDGTVAEVLAENASPVQFGQPLFRVVPG